ncbi:alpha/beta fold family hydrolase [Nitzschia inconspicua]|uniref:Alpha/beta fold family hydrolase n=1 Tax=Nitzschia inconspicua TaxID=303405 RepID=A0A9K3Q2U8_9STRA|nr:alpha/beta fold family hydrolase [Nitzschia inconspicua]
MNVGITMRIPSNDIRNEATPIIKSVITWVSILMLFLVKIEGFAPGIPWRHHQTQNKVIGPWTTTTTTTTLYNSAPAPFSEGERNDVSTIVNNTTDIKSTSATQSVSRTTRQTFPSTKSVQRHYRSFPWNYQGEHFDINYRVEGPTNGPPILLIHGFGANLNHFRYQFPVLTEAGYRVHALDLLGFGASPKPGHVQYSMELYVQLVTDFIQSRRNKSQPRSSFRRRNIPPSWIVAGNSIGGLICLGVAAQLPDTVRGVILFNCSGGMTGFRYSDVPMWARPILWFFQKILLGPHVGSSFFSRFKTRANIESILRHQGVYRNQTNVDDELLDILLRPAEDDGAETVFLKTFAGDPGPTPEEILPNLQCPVLAVWGGDDPWTPVDSGMHPGTKFSDYCQDFELHTIPNCGHCPHDEAPDVVNFLILSWMKNLDSRQRTAR